MCRDVLRVACTRRVFSYILITLSAYTRILITHTYIDAHHIYLTVASQAVRAPTARPCYILFYDIIFYYILFYYIVRSRC